MPSRLVLFALLVFAAPAAAFTIDLPTVPEPAVEGPALFARIDSLEIRHAAAGGADRAALATRLALLHRATGLSSHAAIAQEYFAEAIALDPARPEPVYWSAIALQQSEFYTLARARLRELLEREPDDPEHLLVLARLEFVEARIRPQRHEFSAAYQIYLRLLAQQPDRTEVLVGAGATALLVGNHQLARSCGERLRDRHPERVEGWYLSAAANLRLGNVEPSWVDFLQGISRAGAVEREAFLGGTVLVRDEELAAIARNAVDEARARTVEGAVGRDGKIDWVEVVTDPAIRAECLERWWARRDPSPAAFENESELEYWTRLVEADLLFGSPESGARGWESLPGEVWTRLGRPLSRFHWLPGTTNDATEAAAPRPQTKRERGYRRLAFDPPSVFWDWSYLIDGKRVVMRFVDESYGQPQWSIGAGGGIDLGVLRTGMAFVEPARHRPAGAIELYASMACFPRGSQALLETALSAHCPEGFDLARAGVDSIVVEWILEDSDGAEIDRVERVLSSGHRLSTLLVESGAEARGIAEDPFLAMVGARLDPGDYRVGVRVIDPRTGLFSSKTFDVVVPETRLDGPLALSSVQLSHGMPSWDRSSPIPVEFVKHGRVVLAAADATIAGNALGVFYELSNLATDETGQTRFDVEYAIYEATGQVRLLSMLGEFDAETLEEVELSTVEYLHERTGVSAEGLVVKGTEIDISGLREGDYALRIKVDDLLSGDSVSTTVAFRRSVLTVAKR